MEKKSPEQVREIIRNAFAKKLPAYDESSAENDLFDHGATSLMVIDLQLEVEASIGWSVEAHLLMQEATLDGWTNTYVSNRREA